MTTTKAVPAPSTYRSGHCSAGFHDRCRGTYAGVQCTCPHHSEPVPEPEPEVLEQPPGPAARLTRAAIALDVDHQPMPPAAVLALARLLRSEGAHAADRGDHYPADRAPLLELADLILEGTAP